DPPGAAEGGRLAPGARDEQAAAGQQVRAGETGAHAADRDEAARDRGAEEAPRLRDREEEAGAAGGGRSEEARRHDAARAREARRAAEGRGREDQDRIRAA